MDVKRTGCRFLFQFLFFLIVWNVPSAMAAGQEKGGGLTVAGQSSGMWYSNSVALVIGIGQYGDGWPSLDEPVNDANRVAEALKKQGFEIFLLTDKDATKANILHLVQTKIPNKLDKDGRFVFYFSGHGQTEIASRTGKQLGYLIPQDGRRNNNVDDWSSYISMDTLRSQINNKINSKHVMIIFDSCFSGTALTKGGALSGSIQYFLSQPAINVLTAGDAGQPTPDGVFSYDFVNAISGSADGVGGMRDGYVTFAEIGSYLQSQIPAKVPNLSPSFGWWDGTSQMIFRYGSSDLTAGSDLNLQKSALIKQKEDYLAQSIALEQEQENLDQYKAKVSELNRLKKEGEQIRLQQQALAEKRKLLDQEKKALETADNNLFSPTVAVITTAGETRNIVRTKGQYQVTSCGTIIDTKSGLEWYVGPDKAVYYKDALEWADTLMVCGGDWRLPSIAELKTLYKKGSGERNMDELFTTTGWFVWSGDSMGDEFSARGLVFTIGKMRTDHRYYANGPRAFAVRFVK